MVVLDDQERILSEYGRNVATNGQLGVGGRFYIWILRNRWNPEACEQVTIAEDPNSPDGCDFAEFPNDPDLDGFDRDDRKFVAVARGSAFQSPIFNASDTGWWDFRGALDRNGVDVRFVCPELMANG